MYWMTYPWPWPKVTAVALISTNLLVCTFSLKNSDVFFQGQTLFWYHLSHGWSDWCEMKWKCFGWIPGMISYLEMKRKRIIRILSWLYDFTFWPHPWPWPWSFKVRVWNSLISGMGWPIDMERKGCASDVGVSWTYLVSPVKTFLHQYISHLQFSYLLNTYLLKNPNDIIYCWLQRTVWFCISRPFTFGVILLGHLSLAYISRSFHNMLMNIDALSLVKSLCYLQIYGNLASCIR